MTRLRFDYDFSYEAATGQPFAEVFDSLMAEAAKLATDRLRALAPVRTGRLSVTHRYVAGRGEVRIFNDSRYAEFVLPTGSKGRWRWWMAREFRNAFEDVSIARFGDVEDAVLASIGPIPREGQRRAAIMSRMAARREGRTAIAVPRTPARPSRAARSRGAR